MHRIFAWGRPLLAVCLATFCVGVAQAQADDYETLPEWYVGVLGGVVLPDAARNADQGVNAEFILGGVLAESLAVELNGFGGSLPSSIDGVDDQSLVGGGLDLTLGTPAPGNPIFMFGGGAISQEIAGQKQTSTFGNLGLGVYLPFSLAGELWRLEGRYNVVFNDHPALPDEELLEDGRVNLGVLFTFGDRAAPVEAYEEPEAAPDADGDGIPDAMDKCADTPRWIRPDANGCTPDTDGDGIAEDLDSCPATPPGTAVDPRGCPPSAESQSLAATQAPESADADGDGVPDHRDACPGTTAGLAVDGKGCVKPEEIVLRNVHFDLESSRLTADGFMLLRQIAMALSANPDMRLEVSGHADATGSRGYNEKISVERAEVVRDFLNYLGISESRMHLKAYGELKPIADNKTDEGRAFNRRVEFRRLD